MQFNFKINDLIENHTNVKKNLQREEVIRQVIQYSEAHLTQNGCLAAWTPKESTGRSPADTYVVKTKESKNFIDWDSSNNLAISEETFAMLLEDAFKVLSDKKHIYVTERVLGADSSYALPVRTITDKALTALFTLNMFRPFSGNIGKSVFNDKYFTILVLPYDKIDINRYQKRLRRKPDGKTSDMAIVMDFTNRIGLVFGSAYCGSVKKLLFTVMNYYLPFENVLPMHCAANESENGDVALFFGLSGTGKTTLSADANRALFGDDEHGWSENGIANFENGCYAKLINLDPEKEPEIYRAVFHKDKYFKHGAIVENTMVYPDGSFDLYDDRLTPNSRASFPLTFLSNIKKTSTGSHPKIIFFLTADANGVLPPISRLNTKQAMLWFLMGYTSKLAGTETGIIKPVTTFSRFFGQPFMPSLPHYYSDLLGKKLQEHEVCAYLVNTGWTGGSYGVGNRIDITVTRAMIDAALNGSLEQVKYYEDKLFHILVPLTCPNVSDKILNPGNTWENKKEYKQRAEKLAAEFSAYFDKVYKNKNIDPEVCMLCPGK